MQPVEIIHNDGNVVLRARTSELLILSLHVKELQALKKPSAFADYFKKQALVNRPARKLFEAWLRKDGTLWPRIFKTVHEEMDPVVIEESQDVQEQIKEDVASTKSTEINEINEITESSTAAKAAKKTTKKAAKKTTKKAAKKTTKKK